MAKQNSAALLMAAMTHHHAGRLSEAQQAYEQVLCSEPGQPAALDGLGTIALQRGQWLAARDLILRAMAGEPSAHLACNLGVALKALGQKEEALAAYRDAIRIDPGLPETYLNLGVLLHAAGQWEDAESCYRSALHLRPQYAEALDNLGSVLTSLNRLSEARQRFEQAIDLWPRHAPLRNNLGNLLWQQGRLIESIACYRKALAWDPTYHICYSNMLLAMSYSEQVSPEALADAAREYGRRYAGPLVQQKTWRNTREPGRRLRLGYVSADLRKHPVSYFLEPLLAAHHRDEFELFAYSNQSFGDEVTQRLRSMFDHWRDIATLDDERVANLIESDCIDVLVDLSGHTSDHRLLVFARKPAPLQVTWLGFPATTGVPAMDFRLTDVHGDPPGMTEHLFSETLLRLPTVFCCYRPPELNLAPAACPPSERQGYFTFGCLNNYAKLTDGVVEVWSRLLLAVQGSRLLLEIRGVDEESVQREVERRFAAHGVSADRLRLVARAPQNQYVLYREIDLALDPFPCNGGTTSFDALWMGVPFVALEGRHFGARMGVTILKNMGLGELIAQNETEYIRIAASLAADLERLKAMRADLRGRFLASPLADHVAFGAHVESAFRQAWRQWCARE